MAKVNLYYTADQHPVKTVDFPVLSGGLNIDVLDYRLPRDESPDMLNLWWEDGILQCRDSQRIVSPAPETPVRAFTSTRAPFHGVVFFHVGSQIQALDVTQELGENEILTTVSGEIAIPQIRGTFFEYSDDLYYKTRFDRTVYGSGFYRIKYNARTDGNDPMSDDPRPITERFTFEQVVTSEHPGHVPTILMNADPATGSGDMYQPENRLCKQKKVQYNAAETTGSCQHTADGAATTFAITGLSAGDVLTAVREVYVGIMPLDATEYTVDLTNASVALNTAPENGAVVTIQYAVGVRVYKLPVDGIESVDEVLVDGAAQTIDPDYPYTVDLRTGTVTFTVPPPVHDPAVNNTVEITYSKTNEAAYNAFGECRFATTFGSGQELCILMGGSLTQHNAFFWNSNNSVAMDPTYWPVSYYNLAGDTDSRVTGFGVQYGVLFVFSEDRVGRATYGVEDVDGRQSISFTYTNVNKEIGCDLPWSIQLVDNNLVFANTSTGVYTIRDSNWANENSLVPMSRKINGSDQRHGLLYAVRTMTTTSGKRFVADNVSSWDDGKRYWLVGGDGLAFLWDYTVSDYKNPSWFPQDNIRAVSFFSPTRLMIPDNAHELVSYTPDNKTYEIDQSGRVCVYERTFADFNGEAIKKRYQFPPQFFGSYDRLKDIMRVIFAVRSDTNTDITITYDTDYETREDKTNIKAYGWHLVPRDLTKRILSVNRYAKVGRRKPCTRHLKHFAMRLENAQPFQDLAIVSAEIYYRFLGKDR